MRFVVVILVLIHDCHVCSFFALFLFFLFLLQSLYIIVCIFLSLRASSVIRSSLLVFLFPSTSPFVLFCSVGSSRFVTQQEGKGAGILLVFYTSLHCSFWCVFPPFFRMCVVHGAWTDVAISNATTSIVNSSLLSAVSVADGSVDTYPGHHLLFYHFVSARERIPFVGRECQDAHMYASL